MKPRKTQRKVTLTTITATDIYHLVEQFTRDRPLRKTTRGRKPLYPEALILTLALLQVAQRATYRQLLFGLAPPPLPQPTAPCIGYPALSVPDPSRSALARGVDLAGEARDYP